MQSGILSPALFGACWENGAGEVVLKWGQTDRRGGGEKARNLNGARKQPADRLTEGLTGAPAQKAASIELLLSEWEKQEKDQMELLS